MLFVTQVCYAQEYYYILNDKCIVNLAENAQNYFYNSPINIVRDSRGIILRFELEHPEIECNRLSINMYSKIIKIKEFLAKINNPVIIEVHVNEISVNECKKLKKWEVSTLIANNIETVIKNKNGIIVKNRINSVGFGEFMPDKNTSNNGSNYPNRIDIIILCDINGE